MSVALSIAARKLGIQTMPDCVMTVAAFRQLLTELGGRALVRGADETNKASAMTLLLTQVITVWSVKHDKFLNFGHVFGVDVEDDWIVAYKLENDDAEAC